MTNEFVFACLLLFLFQMCDIRKDDLKLEWTFFRIKIWVAQLLLLHDVAKLSSCVGVTPLLTLIIFVEGALGHRKDEAILTL